MARYVCPCGWEPEYYIDPDSHWEEVDEHELHCDKAPTSLWRDGQRLNDALTDFGRLLGAEFERSARALDGALVRAIRRVTGGA